MQTELDRQANTPFQLIWGGVSGAVIPIILLLVSIALSMAIGVMASEDWGGFAKRIDVGKTAAFYISLIIWAVFAIKAYNPAAANRIKQAQAAGLAVMLILWLIIL